MARFKFSHLKEDAERRGGFHFVEIYEVFKMIVFTYGLPVSSQPPSLCKIKAALYESLMVCIPATKATKATSISCCEVEG